MMFNDFEKVKYNYFKLLGSGLGLAKPEVLTGNRNFSGIKMSVLQLSIPSYFKTMYKMSDDMIYHISGYGQSNEEALTRALGETVERYSFMSFYWLIKNRLKNSSYNDLKEENVEILPMKYINTFGENDKFFHFLNDDDITQWLKLKNYCTGQDVYYPISMITTDIFTKKHIFPAMSTGTATHISYERALVNALTEQLQIHLFMTAWYGLKKLPVVDLDKIPSAVRKILKETFNDDAIDITILDCGLEKIGFYNYISIIKSKNGKYPYSAIGVQGGLNSEATLLRSIMEACAIYVNLQGMYIYKDYLINKLNSENVLNQYNLDAPFLFWSNYNDVAEKEKILESLIDYNNRKEFVASPDLSTENQLKILLNYFTKTLNYFSILEISSLDSYECGYRTVRSIAPELVTMNYPALVFENHPYFKNKGGVKNGNFSHPLP